MYTTFMTGAWGSQKRELAALELKLWMVVSSHMGARNQVQSSARATRALDHWAVTPAPKIFFKLKVN